MPDLVFHRFDEEANIHVQSVSVSSEELGASRCSLPARFLGGTCDRFYTCKEARRCSCKASHSRLARDKAAHGELGEEIREDLLCAVCGQAILLDSVDRPYHGDPGTSYEGQPVCETCYDEDLCEPSATIYYGVDSDEPCLIGACRNETEGNFKVRWHRTDAWRGYYELESEVYTQVFTDAILSGHESEQMLKKLYDIVLERFDEEGIDFARAFTRSSNVFMTCLEIWVRKDLVQLMRAHLILAQAMKEVDYDNDLYKTGILFPRESLEQLKRLLGDRYQVNTDSDIADLVNSKFEDLIREIMQAAQERR